MKNKINFAAYQANKLANTLENIESCLITLKKEDPFPSINKLTMEIGRQVDLDPSIFRKRKGPHRKLLDKYVKELVFNNKTAETSATSIEALAIRNKELSRKVTILERELKTPSNKLALIPTTPKQVNSNIIEIDSLCMLIDDILKCQRNLQFKDGALYNYETFSEEEELVSIVKNCKTYLDWKDGRRLVN
ncbi:hypothetical protein C4K04_1598 [Pseudomonas chlororaphis]|uniref:Uncharacterized protein n=1 Tax=Pseudomonas chlororaphis TaxID=587753 RepID=A0A3G7TL23_9PSED|nr:hypothetical protein [Pseudomonas chlororaphis]AZE47288.1 hypothetical protein C4K04_1598 [Pseudomonas chlororaphis]